MNVLLPPPIPSAAELPPPVPRPREGTFFHLARASWITALIAIALGFVVSVLSHGQFNPALVAGFGILCFILGVIGVLSSLIAPFGMIRHGWRGLLLPSLAGLFLWLLLLSLAMPAFLRARQRAIQERDRSKAAVLQPAIHSSEAQRVQDSVLGYSFDVPPGYTAVPATAKLQGNYAQAFMCRIGTEMPCMLLVQHLGGELPPHRLTHQSIPAHIKGTLETFHWRGREVDGFHVVEKANGRDYVTYNVQIPLKGKAIQIDFGGPGEAAAQMRDLAEEVLATLDGQPSF